MTTILKVNNVTKRFGELAAVKDLSFEVEEGTIFGVAGPNGSGKTTLFNLISGFYNYEGLIVFNEKSISRLRPYQICKQGISRIFQNPMVFSTLTVYENLRVGAHFGTNSKQKSKIITDVLDFLELNDKKNTKASKLSLFDKKMTMLGAALATEPRLLLLDEPIGGLSPLEIEKSIKIFKRMNAELGITIVVIEHVMKFLMRISDRMMILHNGEEICIGSPEEVTNNKQVIEVYLGAEYA